ncbi:DUF624 domain-containing protein [Streptococcus sp. S784/96/1]|uniref:DUF624 domain-containing protein n=1 Tax=Streptococcus sp. S784/96/1 TaxID=2653499 RepID=UPI00138744DE|nr:DUF624 domain-containing protein [Streptococcus sp. S784/96/1]
MKKTSTSIIKTIFGLDNAFVRICALIYDLFLVNVIFILTCLPVFTIGMAKRSLYVTLVKRRQSAQLAVVRTYLQEFKSKKGFILGLIELFLIAVCFLDIVLLLGQEMLVAQLIKVLSFSILFLVAMTFLMVYPLETRVELPIKETLKRSFLLAGIHLPVTLITMTVLLGILFILFYSGFTLLIGLSLLSLGGYAGLVYVHLYLIEKRIT